jgi:hypothetical protein
LEKKREEQVLHGGFIPVCEGEVGKGYGRVNNGADAVYMYKNGKVRPVETIPGMGRGRVKKYSRGGEFKYDIFDTL